MGEGAVGPRRAPKQARARATHATILEAAARILDSEGERGFTTNRVAARAGVSIGTLYQYFPNKQAILVAMSQHEAERLRREVAEGRDADPVRAALRRLIHAFESRPNLRRASVRAALQASLAGHDAAAWRAEAERAPALLPPIDALSTLETFVLSRAVMGAVRAAVLEAHPSLYEPEFEDALMTLVDGVRAIAAARSDAAETG